MTTFAPLVLAFAPQAAPKPEKHPGPSVLLITLDTTRRDFMGFLGCTPSPTPNLDALAARSVVFTDAVTTAPLTLPAHASLMTGLYPCSHGVHDNSLYRLPDDAHTLAEMLHEQGYATGAAVAAFVLDPIFGLGQGFDRYSALPRNVTTRASLTFDERRAKEMVDIALADLAELAPIAKPGAAAAARPFFYWLHLFDPHSPYDAQSVPAVSSVHALDPTALVRALYQAEITAMDQELGRLFRELDARGLRERLLVVVAADHGEGLGDGHEETHGHFLFDPTVRIPLLLSDPRLAPQRLDLPVSLVDVVPTVLARVGVDAAAERFDGLDLSPWIADPQEPPPDRVLALESWYVWLEYSWAPFEGCTSGPLKYVRSQQEELFDRAHDPGETKNLFVPGDPRAQGLRGRLAAIQATGAAAALARANPGLSDADRRALVSLGYATGGGNALLPEGDWSRLPSAYAKLGAIKGFDDVANAIERKEYARAIELLRGLVASEPGSALFHEQLGFMLVNVDSEHLEEAERELKRALALDPRRARVWFALARIALQRRDAARAEAKQLREQDDPKSARRVAKVDREQVALAEAAMRECLRLEPTYPEALIELARLLYDEAERAVRAQQKERALQLYAEVEQLADRVIATLPADGPDVKDAVAAQRLSRARRAELERQQ